MNSKIFKLFSSSVDSFTKGSAADESTIRWEGIGTSSVVWGNGAVDERWYRKVISKPYMCRCAQWSVEWARSSGWHLEITNVQCFCGKYHTTLPRMGLKQRLEEYPAATQRTWCWNRPQCWLIRSFYTFSRMPCNMTRVYSGKNRFNRAQNLFWELHPMNARILYNASILVHSLNSFSTTFQNTD